MAEYDSWQEDSDEGFVPLTSEQARALRERHPGMSAGRVVAMQTLCALVLSGLAGLITPWGWSVAYGAFAVVFPSALFARGISPRPWASSALSAVATLLVWEIVKVVLTLAVLFGARWLVKDLSWPALLAGLVITLKVHWLAMAIEPKSQAIEM
ncbi:MAG: ATP synthase subunit I [Betaproteobacteria bacterium]|jgi:ATP synthase protein I